ncbi:hypothetical protein Scep_019992 [Stephania cephalantha]|uniref:Uncharacterized protein n=1 Tax=Stephania cephalantha TaxID=152367 RepID=A0AAP0IC93_9MAGN
MVPLPHMQLTSLSHSAQLSLSLAHLTTSSLHALGIPFLSIFVHSRPFFDSGGLPTHRQSWTDI